MARRQTKTFLHVLRHSLIPYDNYYAHILNKTPFSFSLKYFVVLSVFLVIIELAGAYIGATKSYPFLKSQAAVSAILNQVPADLVITLNHGKLLTNSDRPILIFNPSVAEPGTLAVIDQKADKNKIYEYEARYLFTENELVTNINGQVMTFEYAEKKLSQDPLTIPLGAIAKESPKLISALFMVLVLLLPVSITLFRLLLLTIISIVVFVICAKFMPKMKLANVFQISLHAVTAPIAIQSVTSALGLAVPLSFWWFNMMITIFLIAALYEAYVIAENHTRTSPPRP